ncbi:hypothetical protein K456DRAFT_376888 [Colletotrichum gloeosporioides 23]|nr:hypothetical protein K456DRAFT_376888 [Colletotrichum gloeosporioides 23]
MCQWSYNMKPAQAPNPEEQIIGLHTKSHSPKKATPIMQATHTTPSRHPRDPYPSIPSDLAPTATSTACRTQPSSLQATGAQAPCQARAIPPARCRLNPRDRDWTGDGFVTDGTGPSARRASTTQLARTREDGLNLWHSAHLLAPLELHVLEALPSVCRSQLEEQTRRRAETPGKETINPSASPHFHRAF